MGEWAAANNVELAYTPTYSSWLNRIGAQFQALRYFALDGTDHGSHREQASMNRRYVHWRNRNAHDRASASSTRAPIPTELITGLYQVDIRVEPRLPIAGYAHWATDTFLIHVNANDHPYEQRLTIAHELSHIVDHIHDEAGLATTDRQPHGTAAKVDELVAEYFARCVLMPKSLVQQHYASGHRDVRTLSRVFAVPRYAVQQRLAELGIVNDRKADSRSLWKWIASTLWNRPRNLPSF